MVLSPRSNDFCSIDTLHGVNIEAEEVSFDTKNSQVLLTKAKGLVNVIKEAPTDISADLAVWDETGGVLTLIGDATVSHPLIATICNSGRISFVWNESEIDYMTVVGETEITRMNHLGGADYHLTVGGNITIDHVLKRIYIEKKANQIQYTDKIGHVFGDTLVLDYDIKGKRIHPCKVQLTDNVKLLSIASASTDIDTNTAQYALAETMLYNPLTKELSLSGKNESRVLYYDKINNLQISAPKLFYTQGMKDTVKGVGDVRFRFVEQEINEIKKRFKFEG